MKATLKTVCNKYDATKRPFGMGQLKIATKLIVSNAVIKTTTTAVTDSN